MSLRSRPRPPLATLLFLAAVSAAAPVVRHCPFELGRMELRDYAACSAMPKAGGCLANAAACETAGACSESASREPASGRTDADAACREPAGACAGEASVASAEPAECPMAMAEHATHSGCTSCPFAPRSSSSHTRGSFCLDEPGMAGASRVHPPAPPTPLAVAATIVTIEAPATTRPVEPVADARPPTPPGLARPPIRGPPLLLG